MRSLGGMVQPQDDIAPVQDRPAASTGSDRILGALARTTASGEFIPAVDGLRFIAIAAVVLHHITAEYIKLSQRFGVVDLPRQWWEVFPQSPFLTIGYAGHFGVPLFFVISGFILALPYVRSHDFGAAAPNIWSYYLRRIVRLDPPYIISLLVAFAVISFTNIGWRVFFPHLWASMLYLHGAIYGEASWVNGVAWSLEVEVQFYVLVPLLSKFFALRPIWLRRITLFALILGWAYAVANSIIFQQTPALSVSIVGHLQFFLAGFLLADLYSHHRIIRSLAGDLLALASAAAIYWILTHDYGLYYLTPILIAAMYVGVCSGQIGYRIVTQRWIVTIGGMCYSIYLYHYLIIHLFTPLSARLMDRTHAIGLELLLQAVVLIPAILILSACLYLGVEKPCMQISRWIGRKTRGGQAASGAIPQPATTPY
ncbi:MAG: acyltransferase [Bradyrhizobium sp.]|uniref:acyltransferase family protein n=1 Tax=Bradyrhizobium sp. TaxID=376 RepID=UPI001227D374|nr:acyltransferase [Bradyrhizobium sp.]THD73704.1 MAG: acyltransferase [Bradyrhizobium sp.]